MKEALHKPWRARFAVSHDGHRVECRAEPNATTWSYRPERKRPVRMAPQRKRSDVKGKVTRRSA